MAQKYSPTIRVTAPTSAPPMISMPQVLLHRYDAAVEPDIFAMDDAELVQDIGRTFESLDTNMDPAQEIVYTGAHLARVDEGSAYRSLVGQLAKPPVEVPPNMPMPQASLHMDFPPAQRRLPELQLPASMPQTIAYPVDTPTIAISQCFGQEQRHYIDPNYGFQGFQYNEEILTSTPFNSFQSTDSSWLPLSGPQSSYDFDRPEPDLQSSNTAPSSFDISTTYFPGQSSFPSASVASPYMHSHSDFDETGDPYHADPGHMQMMTPFRGTNVSSWTQGAYNVLDRTNFGGLAPEPTAPPGPRRGRVSHSRAGSATTGPIPCQRCGKMFPSRSARDHHARWHGPKDQICTTCAKGFVAIKDLRRHEKTHKPAEHEYFCGSIGCIFNTKGFARKDHFVRHLKTHGTVVTPLDAIPGFPATF